MPVAAATGLMPFEKCNAKAAQSQTSFAQDYATLKKSGEGPDIEYLSVSLNF